jgi:hypothetical protein
MALVADVHSSDADCLEEAVGHAFVIHAIVPIEGKLYLTRGATFSYYEFRHPLSDRLTDEQWQQMVKSGKLPKRPEFTRSFSVTNERTLPGKAEEFSVMSTGC